RVMFLKNDRELSVKNGSSGTVAEMSRTSMRVVLNGPERRDAKFALSEYAALDLRLCGHRAQSAGERRSIALYLLATPGHEPPPRVCRHDPPSRGRRGLRRVRRLQEFPRTQGAAVSPRAQRLNAGLRAQRRGLKTARTEKRRGGGR